MKSLSHGRLIVFEGIDGCGKSTLAKSVFVQLQKKQCNVVLTKEPGGTPFGVKVRNLIIEEYGAISHLSQYLLFAADRAHHIESLVKPALAENKIVLSDRMGDSSFAYQGYGHGLDREMILKVNQWAMQDVEPDLIVYLELDPHTACQRRVQRAQEHELFDQEKIMFFERVIKGFEAAFAHRKNILRLDARLAPEVLVDAVVSYMNQNFFV